MVKFIDLFSGIGGIREGFEQACADRKIDSQCVFTSDIKPASIKVFNQNHPNEEIKGDITKIDPTTIPDFDVLLAGFPCQAFSSAGKRLGFDEARGLLIFYVAKILEAKQPKAFVLENVEGLVKHDMKNAPKDSPIGYTLLVILKKLQELGYKTSWKLIDASEYGIPQQRKRVYIVGTKIKKPNLEGFQKKDSCLADVLESGLPTVETQFTKRLIKLIGLENLPGMSIKDKRGGSNNIHSWDLQLKGKTTQRQRDLLNRILTERRKKKWAKEYGIVWMDGMPLTLQMIESFWEKPGLQEDLDYLVQKKYLKLEHPKQQYTNESGTTYRVPVESLPLGYNIVSGKMSFEINEVLDPSQKAPTLVAMDMAHLYVVDGDGLRPLSLREGLRLFGYPDKLRFDVSKEEGYDLLGNTVVVPIIKLVSGRVLDVLQEGE